MLNMVRYPLPHIPQSGYLGQRRKEGMLKLFEHRARPLRVESFSFINGIKEVIVPLTCNKEIDQLTVSCLYPGKYTT